MAKAAAIPAFTRLVIALMLTLLIAACGGVDSNKSTGATMPSQPVTLEIVDAGGYVTQFGKVMIDNFVKANPKQVSKVNYLARINSPELPGKLQVEEASGHVSTSLVFTGYDGLTPCINQNLLQSILPQYSSLYQSSINNYAPGAQQYQTFTQGYGLVVATTPSGPIFEYDPAKVQNPPQTIQDLKAWIIAHPKQFLYAQPPNSGPGRTMIMGLPYLLNDSNPSDPNNGWANTWQFLKDIKSSMLTPPTTTGETFKDLTNGTVSIIASTFGFDLTQKILKQIPTTFKTFMLQGTKFVPDSALVAIPKGIDTNTQIVVHNLIKYMLSPEAQVITYSNGSFYPGPAIKGIPLSDAPDSIKNPLSQTVDPNYDNWIKNTAVVKPLAPADLVSAFNKWKADIAS
jgi:putative spermidine/putrescine transport system substrate-binding protein